MDHRPHIVVVEDEAAQRQLLVDYLGRQNFRVSGADGGTALRKLLERELPALVLLDIGLPGEDGFVLARWLRERSGRIGIIMVTAAADTVDRVVGLETGADDYIAKPFEPRELLARVKSVLRRTTGATASTGPRVRMGRRVLDLEKRVLIDPASGDEETLAASELDLLKVFAENPNRPLNRDWLLEVTAHREMEAFDRAIDLRITRLRRKIEVDPVPSRRDPHRARRRLHVRAAERLNQPSSSMLRRARRLIDLGERAAQLGGERTQPLAAAGAVAGLAGLLERGGRGADAGRADRLGRTLELVRGGRERRQVAGARCGRDLALGRDRGVAEFRQQRVDRGGVVAEPGGEHVAVDRGGRLRGVVGVRRSRAIASSIGIQRSSVARSWSMFTGLAR